MTDAVPTTPPAPRGVSRFEANLVTVLRALLGRVPLEQARKPLSDKFTPPPCLSANCVHLVKDSLAKGVVEFLVTAGGWRADRFLRKGEPRRGRVWDRVPLGERTLAFGPGVLAFLVWVTAGRPADVAPDAAELSPADEVFYMLALHSLREDLPLFLELRGRPEFARNPLCWLNNPADVAESAGPPAFGPSCTGTRAVILECLQPHLAKNWTRTERLRGQIADWTQMRTDGTAAHATLSAFLPAAAAANRTDLARFVLQTHAATLARPDVTAENWTGGLKGVGPPRLADRLDTRRAALAVPRFTETLAAWDAKARGVGYFDDDYAATQVWKEDYEANRGPEAAAAAKKLLATLEPLRAPTPEG